MINEPSYEHLHITLDVRGLTSGRHQRIEVPRASEVWAEQKNRGDLPIEYAAQPNLLAHSDFGLTRLTLGFIALPDRETGRYATLYDPAPASVAEQQLAEVERIVVAWGAGSVHRPRAAAYSQLMAVLGMGADRG